MARRKADPTRISETDYNKLVLEIEKIADKLRNIKHFPVITQVGVRTRTMLKQIVLLNTKKESDRFTVIRPGKETIKAKVPQAPEVTLDSVNQAATVGGAKSKKTRNSKKVD